MGTLSLWQGHWTQRKQKGSSACLSACGDLRLPHQGLVWPAHMGSSWRLGTTLWLWQRLSSSPSSEGTPSTRLWGWLRHEHQRGTTSTRRGRGVSGRSVRASPYSVTGHAEPPLPHAHSEGEWAVPSVSSVNKSFCQPLPEWSPLLHPWRWKDTFPKLLQIQTGRKAEDQKRKSTQTMEGLIMRPTSLWEIMKIAVCLLNPVN